MDGPEIVFGGPEWVQWHSIPRAIGNWSLIDYAYFNDNGFTGTVPEVICPFITRGSDTLVADCELNCTLTCCNACF
jgi:hypothetical protein